ncbi:MAG: hypothetical protein CMF49_02845 [Legionellales bacterium]|nr:hypothetical protein [Legionellales bacterium]
MKIRLTTLAHTSAINYLSLLFNFLFATLLIRFTNKSTYAVMAHVTAYVTLLTTIFTFGHLRSFVRYDGSISEIKPISTLAVLLWFTVTTIVTVSYIIIYGQDYNLTDFLLILITAMSIFANMLLPLWQRVHQVIQYNYWLIGLASLKLILLLFLFIAPIYTNLVLFSITLATCIFTLLLVWQTSLYEPSTLFNNRYNFSHAVKTLILHTRLIGLPFWVGLIAATVYIRIDIILLNGLHIDPNKIGTFAYIEMIIYAILLLPGAISNFIARPLISKEISGIEFWTKYESYIILFSSLLCLGTTFILPVIIQFFLKNTNNISEIVRGFTPGIAFAFLATFFNLALITEHHLKITAWCNILTAITCIIINLWLIPIYGIIGAAYATSFTYVSLSFSFILCAIYYNAWQLKQRRKEIILIMLALLGGFISWLTYILLACYLIIQAKRVRYKINIPK